MNSAFLPSIFSVPPLWSSYCMDLGLLDWSDFTLVSPLSLRLLLFFNFLGDFLHLLHFLTLTFFFLLSNFEVPRVFSFSISSLMVTSCAWVCVQRTHQSRGFVVVVFFCLMVFNLPGLPVSSQVPIVFCFFFVFIYVFATRSFSQVPSDPWLSTLFGSEVVFHV